MLLLSYFLVLRSICGSWHVYVPILGNMEMNGDVEMRSGRSGTNLVSCAAAHLHIPIHLHIPQIGRQTYHKP